MLDDNAVEVTSDYLRELASRRRRGKPVEFPSGPRYITDMQQEIDAEGVHRVRVEYADGGITEYVVRQEGKGEAMPMTDEEMAVLRKREADYERERLRHSFPDIDQHRDEFVLAVAEKVRGEWQTVEPIYIDAALALRLRERADEIGYTMQGLAETYIKACLDQPSEWTKGQPATSQEEGEG